MSQSVTPELRHWIREQSAANLPPDAVVAAMVKVGWQPAVAAAALAQVMREQPGEPLAAPPSLPSLPSAAAVQAAGSSAAGEAMATRGARMPERDFRLAERVLYRNKISIINNSVHDERANAGGSVV